MMLCKNCGEDAPIKDDFCTACGQMVEFKTEDHATDYALIVSFPDQSETFVLGFEAGMIWERLQAGETEIDVNVHTSNIEVLNRMCVAAKVTPKFQPTNVSGWTNFSIKSGVRKPDLKLVKP